MPIPSRKSFRSKYRVAKVEIRSYRLDRSLLDLIDDFTKGNDASLIASMLHKLRLCALHRVLGLIAEFDRARELEAWNDPRGKNAIRIVRIAYAQEEKAMRLLDRTIRGLCDSVDLKNQISLGRRAGIDFCNSLDKSDDLRSLNFRLVFLLAIYQKALLYGFELPDGLLHRDFDELRQYFVEKTGEFVCPFNCSRRSANATEGPKNE